MPEYPDVQLYRRALQRQLAGQRLLGVTVLGPAFLRSVSPALREFEGLGFTAMSRLGKRLVFGFEGELRLVYHPMIAGRLQWEPSDKTPPRRHCQGVLRFESGQLWMLERSQRKRSSLSAVRGDAELAALDPGGLDLLHCEADAFRARLRDAPHTIKRALCDPRRFDGVGNAFSDEILHRARMSPFTHCGKISDEQSAELLRCCREVLAEWEERLWRQHGAGFPPPKAITAFRPEMAVHGKYGQPCPLCAAPIQRVRYAANEMNYCPGCQTGGKIFADRGLSRLLKSEWPKDLESLEEWQARYGEPNTNKR